MFLNPSYFCITISNYRFDLITLVITRKEMIIKEVLCFTLVIGTFWLPITKAQPLQVGNQAGGWTHVLGGKVHWVDKCGWMNVLGG